MEKRDALNALLLLLSLVLTAPLAGQESDEIMDYYRGHAEAAYDGNNPFESGVTFKLATQTIYFDLDSHARIEKADTFKIDYFFSFGKLDSQNVISETSDRTPRVDFTYPNVFAGDYTYNFYPNDVGDSALAIGFDSPNAESAEPVGIAQIDRYNYYLRRLHLHYPNKPDYTRYSRTFSFQRIESLVFPDTISEVAARYGFFSSDNYRVVTAVTDVRILAR